MKDIKNGFEARELNYDIIYVAAMVEDEKKLKELYPPVHSNTFYHHSTIEFKPVKTHTLLNNIGKQVDLEIKGRLTTDKVDVLVVNNPGSTNKHPHITLSTAEGIKPFESNSELEEHYDKIVTEAPGELNLVRAVIGIAVNLKS